MPRICERNIDGTWTYLEGQSDATAGTLIANGTAAGFDPKSLRERVVTDAEWAAAVAVLPKPVRPDPAAALRAAIDGALTDLATPAKLKTVLTEWKKLL